jgi:FHS family L-fucose permease-like MFS transporter
VSIGSLFINYAKEVAGLAEINAKSFLAYYWGGLMIGRFLGSISLGENKSTGAMYWKMAVSALVIYGLISGIVLIESTQSGETFSIVSTLPYLGFMAIQFIGFILGKSRAARTLFIFSLIIICLLVVTTVSGGNVALWTLIAIGLFNSIMWSNIFTLAIKNLGQHTSQGSSLLVMMILGGALVPLLQGWFADMMGGYHSSFFIPMICYLYLAFYGLKGHNFVFKKEYV